MIDVPRLAAEASTIRGIPCSGPSEQLRSSGTSLVGQGSNFHLPLVFDDGVKWMVRIRRRIWNGPPGDALKINALSEVATLSHMRGLGIRVPGAWRSISEEGE